MDLTDQEKQIISDFIYSSIQNEDITNLVNTFISILQAEQATLDMIKSQLISYLDSKVSGFQKEEDGLEQEKQDKKSFLDLQITLFSSLKNKLA